LTDASSHSSCKSQTKYYGWNINDELDKPFIIIYQVVQDFFHHLPSTVSWDPIPIPILSVLLSIGLTLWFEPGSEPGVLAMDDLYQQSMLGMNQ